MAGGPPQVPSLDECFKKTLLREIYAPWKKKFVKKKKIQIRALGFDTMKQNKRKNGGKISCIFLITN